MPSPRLTTATPSAAGSGPLSSRTSLGGIRQGDECRVGVIGQHDAVQGRLTGPSDGVPGDQARRL